VCGSIILKETLFWTLLAKGSLTIPSSKTLNGTVQPSVPYAILSDEAFALRTNLLRPFSGNHLNMKKKYVTAFSAGREDTSAVHMAR
jgi:hypothetical protein